MQSSISAREASWLGAFGRVLFPPHMRCSLCSEPLDQPLDDGLCDACLAQMPAIGRIFCPRCGLPEIHDAKECPDCSLLPGSFSINRSLWRYRDPASKVVQLYKFQKRIHLAVIFAEQMAAKLFCILPREYDIITYVPMHPQAERQRTYNQSEVLARELAYRVGLPCEGMLQKAWLPVAQHQLSRQERLENLRDKAFSPDSKAQKQGLIKGRVLLVDDVFTTGATAHHCSLILSNNGAEEVAVLTIAR